MSHNPEHDGASEQPESHDDTSRAPENDSRNYEVGYRKPPTATRFAKGRSGNPNGRPRKSKKQKFSLSDVPSDMFLVDEALRPITVRENGRTSEMPAAQVIMRSQVAKGIGGNRLSAKFVYEHMTAAKEKKIDWIVKNYVHLATLKREGEKLIADCAKNNRPIPNIIPHPDDIVLRPATYEAFVDGPETPEDVHFFEYSVAWREHCLLRSAHAENTGIGPKIGDGESQICTYIYYAHCLDRSLPKRMRWKHDLQVASRFSHYKSLPRRECERRIKTETENLLANRPTPIYITSEIQREAEKIMDGIITRSRKRKINPE